jgi:hypothetical protein
MDCLKGLLDHRTLLSVKRLLNNRKFEKYPEPYTKADIQKIEKDGNIAEFILFRNLRETILILVVNHKIRKVTRICSFPYTEWETSFRKLEKEDFQLEIIACDRSDPSYFAKWIVPFCKYSVKEVQEEADYFLSLPSRESKVKPIKKL